MKSSLIILSLLLSSTLSFAQYEMKTNYLSLGGETTSQTRLTYKNLHLYPIYAGKSFQQAHADIGRYDNLKQALEEKKVRITEVGNGAETPLSNMNALPPNNREEPLRIDSLEIQQVLQEPTLQAVQQELQNQSIGSGARVNTLMIENTSSDSIFLMAGEVVKGGKQDRVLAQDVVLPPNSGQVDLSVFCVEHSRWRVKEGDSAVFDGYFGVASNRIRKVAVVDKNQSMVWKNVDVVTKKNQAMTHTKTLTALTQSEEYQEQLQAYEAYFVRELRSRRRCVGFVGVTGDQIIGMDVFATPDLFQNQMTHLLHAYITETISEGSKVEVKEEEVMAYMMEFLENEAQQEEKLKERGSAFKRGGRTLHLSTY
ncbi:MAG: DUF6569 family protein [Bacteroidota bacterium]